MRSLAIGLLVAMAVGVGPAEADSGPTEHRARTYILEAHQFLAKNFLCLRLAATNEMDVFVVKPPATRALGLSLLQGAAVPGTVEVRSRPRYDREIKALARLIARHQPTRYSYAKVQGQSHWTTGELCPRVYINVVPPGHFSATRWAQSVARRYAPGLVKAVRATPVRPA
jgi:hypothetical protein